MFITETNDDESQTMICDTVYNVCTSEQRIELNEKIRKKDTNRNIHLFTESEKKAKWYNVR